MQKFFGNSLKQLVPSKIRSSIKKTSLRVANFGTRHRCLLCNSNVKSFLPFGFSFPVLTEKQVVGGSYRQGVLCPVCTSLDRERLLHLYLIHKTDLFNRPYKLLHVAPEPRLKEVLQSSPNLDYLTADFYVDTVMVKMDITDIQYPDNSFDAIICNHVLEHIIDDGKAMSELYRTLKPEGWAILQVPISHVLESTYEDSSIVTKQGRELAFGQDDHVRIYADDYVDRLTQVGFKVKVFKWVDEIEVFGGENNLFGLNKKEAIYCVSK
ncbi:MAG: methyltransferase [Pseudanabaena sp.]|nr:MAG: methyltransferase [Pseudanabaena sp.]